MIILNVMSKKTVYPKGSDYIFDKLYNFQKLVPFLRKKIQGEWLIILADLTLKDLETIETKLEIPDYVKVQIYLSRDVYNNFVIKYPKYITKEKTRAEVYKDIIINLPKLIEPRAEKELYSRCNANIEMILDNLPEILSRAEEHEVITYRDVTSVVMPQEAVYASDVIKSLIAVNNMFIPKKGHPLSRFKYSAVEPNVLVLKLIDSIGRDYAFYALRKCVNTFYEEKLKYLKNIETKNDYIYDVVDIYTLLYMQLFFNSSKPQHLISLIYLIERRQNNDAHLLERTLLSVDD